MKRLLCAAYVLVCLFGLSATAQTVPAGFVNFSGSHLSGSNSVLVANATLCAQPNSGGTPISAQLASGGQTTKAPVCTTVTNGVFSMLLPDTNLTKPQNVCYAVKVTDNITGADLLDTGYSCVQPGSQSAESAWCSSSTCNFDLYTNNIPALAVTQQGPIGPMGAPGIASLPQLALVRTTASPIINLFDVTQITTPCFVDATTGIVHTDSGIPSGLYCSALIPANSGYTMSTNTTIGNFGNVEGEGFNGVAFYGADGVTFISGIEAPNAGTPYAGIQPNTALSIPANAAFIRFSAYTPELPLNQVMLVNGSTVPSAYVGYGVVTPNQLSGLVSLPQLALLRSTPSPVNNLLDTTQLTPSCFIDGTTGAAHTSSSVPAILLCSPLIPANSGGTMVFNGNIGCFDNVAGLGYNGYAFYGADGVTLISAAQAPCEAGLAANTPLTVPANAAYIRFSDVFDGLNGRATLAGAMLVNGSTVPSSYVSYGYVKASQLGNITPTSAAGTPLPPSEIEQIPNAPLAYWYAALHNCKNQVVRFGIVDDSRGIVDTTVSVGGASSLAVLFPHRWAERYRAKIQAACGSHGTGVVPFRFGYGGAGSWASQGFNADYYSGTIGNFVANDVTLGPSYAGDSMTLTATTNGATITLTTAIPYDHLSMICTSGSSLHPWTMTVDGNVVGTCGTSTGSEAATQSLSSAFTLGVHIAVVTCATQPCNGYSLEGVAGTTGVSIDNYSIGGASLEIQATSPAQWAYIDLNPPQLLMMGHGTNEQGIGVPAATFQTSLTNFIAHARAYTYPASVLFFIPIQDNDFPTQASSTYYPLVVSTAAANNTAFVDLRDRWGTAVGPSWLFGPDYIHENDQGNGESFSAIWKATVDVLP